jgi:hypothetical protein
VFFYFDESIQERGRFFVGAFVYSRSDLTPPVFEAITKAGLRRELDEFKSGVRMDGRSDFASVRRDLRALFQSVRIGVTVVPSSFAGRSAMKLCLDLRRSFGLTASRRRVTAFSLMMALLLTRHPLRGSADASDANVNFTFTRIRER